jgi:hypothetical protein
LLLLLPLLLLLIVRLLLARACNSRTIQTIMLRLVCVFCCCRCCSSSSSSDSSSPEPAKRRAEWQRIHRIHVAESRLQPVYVCCCCRSCSSSLSDSPLPEPTRAVHQYKIRGGGMKSRVGCCSQCMPAAATNPPCHLTPPRQSLQKQSNITIRSSPRINMPGFMFNLRARNSIFLAGR